MSKNELSSGETDTFRRSKEPTVRPPTGRQSRQKKRQLYAHDLDVFVKMMSLKDSPAVLSLVYYAKKLATLTNGKKRESPSLIRDGEVTKCSLKNHVPSAPISKEPVRQFQKNLVYPMSFRRRRATDWKFQVRIRRSLAKSSSIRCSKPGEPRPGFGRRPVAQVSRVAQPFKEGLSDALLSDSHTVVVGTTCS